LRRLVGKSEPEVDADRHPWHQDAMSRLLAAGGLAWDRVLSLSAPLAPGARLTASAAKATETTDRLPGRLGGGAANAAIAWSRAGCEAWVAGVVSTDADGAAILHALARGSVNATLVRRTDDASGLTLILLDPNCERTIIGVWPPDRPSLVARYQDLADALPALVRDHAIHGVFLRAPMRPATPLPVDITIVAHWDGRIHPPIGDIVVASSDDLAGRSLGDAFESARQAVGDRLKWLVRTNGANGAEALSVSDHLDVPARPARVVDTTGAGDIFAAGLLEALTAGADMDQALRHACKWGAAAVEQPGSAPLSAPAGAFPRYPD
jgi:sugar/nucleoside kinase (ribokinase family)